MSRQAGRQTGRAGKSEKEKVCTLRRCVLRNSISGINIFGCWYTGSLFYPYLLGFSISFTCSSCLGLPALPCLLFRDDERGKSLVSRCVCDNNNNNNQYIHKVHLHVSRPQRDSRQDSHPRTVTIPTDPVSTILQLGFTSLSSLHHSHTTLPYHRTNRKFNLRYECHLLPVF